MKKEVKLLTDELETMKALATEEDQFPSIMTVSSTEHQPIYP